jgi:hypothetical protein
MNKFLLTVLLLIRFFKYFIVFQISGEAEALGLPGDNLNLYAVLDVFKIQKH